MSTSKALWLISLSAGAMLVALGFQTVTLAGGSYVLVLLVALGITFAADACLAVVACRSGATVRVIALLLMTPTLFIVADFFRRASSVIRP